jgi:hypothetical protein
MEHASAAIDGNYTNQKGPHMCTVLRSQLGIWFPRLLGAAADIKIHIHGSTKNIFNYYGAVECANWPDHSVAFGIIIIKWAYGPFKKITKSSTTRGVTKRTPSIIRCYKRTSSACGVTKEHRHYSTWLSSIESTTRLSKSKAFVVITM